MLLVERPLGLLDEGEDVTQVEDPRRHPVGVEDLEILDALADRGEQDRAASDVRDRERGTTASVAVEFGQDDAGESDTLLEGLRGLDRRLTDHRVDDEEDLVGTDRRPDVLGLRHEVGVDREPASGVDNDDVVLPGDGVLDAVVGDLDRVAVGPGALTGAADRVVPGDVAALGGIDRHSGALPDHFELGDGIGPLQVGGHEHRRVPLLLEPVAQFACEGGLSRPLETGQHDDRGRVLGQIERAGLPAEDGDELLVDDLDDLLARVEGLTHLGAQRSLADRRDERLDDGQGDIGVEQRHPDVAQGRVDVVLGEAPLAAQVAEGRGQPVGQVVEHPRTLPFARHTSLPVCRPRPFARTFGSGARQLAARPSLVSMSRAMVRPTSAGASGEPSARVR
ncbi:MAG: hypothetical protein BWY91_02610 [bacterium ADurb.BinA028]|nr:MAG: hypothetical protein BWY91_02610 [bacterium ADurb.BinA028]